MEWIPFFLFNKYKTKYIFSIFGCWLLPEKLSFCPKNNGFARVRGGGAAAPSPPGSYAYNDRKNYVGLRVQLAKSVYTDTICS